MRSAKVSPAATGWETFACASGCKKAGAVPTVIRHAGAQRSGAIKARRLKKAEREIDFFFTITFAGGRETPILAAYILKQRCVSLIVKFFARKPGIGFERRPGDPKLRL